MDTQTILITLTVLGAISVALLGWLESGEPFNFRKFAASLGRAILSGFVSALIFQDTKNPTTFTYLSALLIGAGIDVFGNRLSGAYSQVRYGE